MRSIALAALLVSGAAVADPSPDRQQALMHLLRQDCGSCHGLTMKGGLGPALTPADLADKASDMLADTITYGRKGTPMPPWGHEIDQAEALWLIDQLKKGLPDAR